MSDQERLKNIRYHVTHYPTRLSVPDELFLLAQAERAQGLEDAIYGTAETYRQEREYNQRLEKENVRLREALEFYADPENYEVWEDSNPETEYMFNIDMDEGSTARRALESK